MMGYKLTGRAVADAVPGPRLGLARAAAVRDDRGRGADGAGCGRAPAEARRRGGEHRGRAVEARVLVSHALSPLALGRS